MGKSKGIRQKPQRQIDVGGGLRLPNALPDVRGFAGAADSVFPPALALGLQPNAGLLQL